MLKIRMQRVGRIGQPSYRIVVTEHTASPKAGKFVEKLGTYNPRTKARTLNEGRVKYWMSVGAKPSDTMHNMLIGAGVILGKKINVLPAYKPAPIEASGAPEAVSAAETPAAEAPAETAPEAPTKKEAAADLPAQAGETKAE
ncbi:MAG TPA: 30S ribosomal protein S16 [Candidatus Paceibacterota bacterium]|nr:30S ribosomal protein S16 [Candidatus Paceibacterota bacterium]